MYSVGISELFFDWKKIENKLQCSEENLNSSENWYKPDSKILIVIGQLYKMQKNGNSYIFVYT